MNFFRKLFAAITFVLCATTAFAVPEIAVEQPIYDFGSIHEGKKVVHVFAIRNKGTSPLIIKDVKSSCGCTAVSSSASTIAPGKSGEIRATFDSTKFSGPIHKTITVKTNDPKFSTTTLSLKGTVIEEILITPKELNLGEVKSTETKKAVFTVVNNGSKPLNLAALKSPVAEIVAEADVKTLAPGKSTKIVVTITPRSGDRVVSGYVAIPTGKPAKPEILVAVYGSVVK